MQVGFETQSWPLDDVAWFRRTSDPLGTFSNFAKQMPIRINGVRVRSSEHLYQAMRFPHAPDIQQRIIDAGSPKACKIASREFMESTRDDWLDVRVDVMRWVLARKTLAHTSRMTRAFDLSAEKTIVEYSTRDSFWGAKPISEDVNEITVEGQNVLGILLTELRAEFRRDVQLSDCRQPKFPDAMLLSNVIEV